MKPFSAKDYDAWYETPLGKVAHAIEKDLIFSLARLKEGQSVLDAGCGTGIYSLELAQRGADATGVDASIEMLYHAKAKLTTAGLKAKLIQADALALPFDDETFDMVLSIGMLCFVKGQEAALKEMRRVLKPGGSLVVGVLNRWSPWAAFRRVKGRFKESIYNEADFLSPRDLGHLLKKTGFEAKELKTRLFFPPINNAAFLKLARPFEMLGALIAPADGAFLVALAIKKEI